MQVRLRESKLSLEKIMKIMNKKILKNVFLNVTKMSLGMSGSVNGVCPAMHWPVFLPPTKCIVGL